MDIPDDVLAAFGLDREGLPPEQRAENLPPEMIDGVLELGQSKSARYRRRLRVWVFERDDFTCVNCETRVPPPPDWQGEGYPGLTLGHIVPDSKGGTYCRANCVAQCERCQHVTGNGVWSAIGIEWTV